MLLGLVCESETVVSPSLRPFVPGEYIRSLPFLSDIVTAAVT